MISVCCQTRPRRRFAAWGFRHRRAISESILHGSGNHQECDQRKTARRMKNHFVSGSAHLGKATHQRLLIPR
jgi:hypothetical protein